MGINTATAPRQVDRNIQLSCWVQGGDHNETFPIAITGTNSVGAQESDQEGEGTYI